MTTSSSCATMRWTFSSGAGFVASLISNPPAPHATDSAIRGQPKSRTMSKITRVEVLQVDLPPKVVRTDAIQSFVTQETPMVRIHTADGLTGTGYSYTIGTGGSSVVALIRDHLAPRLIGRDYREIEAIWKSLFFATHATAVGAITSLALAAIDIALWDLRCRAAGRPLWLEAGGAQQSVPVYTTEGGWLHIDAAAIIDDTL